MNRLALCLVASGLSVLAAPVAADPPKLSADAAALSARIDAFLEAAWTANKIKPAANATDSEFLRRVHLDLAGRIPSVAETRAFLADNASDKRPKLIAQLLQRPTYAKRMTTVWRRLLLPEADTSRQFPFFVIGFESWLREQFAKNTGYDQVVRELLTAPINQQARKGGLGPNANVNPSPMAYYLLKESKPENLASSSARVFLGLRLECAQCHDHPFATWTREQFWGLAAFFAGMQQGPRNGNFDAPVKEVMGRTEIAIPGTQRMVQAAFPDDAAPKWKFNDGPRQILAEWMIAKNNPYFARATANRVWAHLFGVGLVEPVDEMVGGQDTKILDADLLDELAKAFVDHKYDLKFLFEAIAGSKAYQLSSRGQGMAPLFSRQPLRGLTGEQLYDSLAVATGQPDAAGEDPVGRVSATSARTEFITKFSQQTAKPTEHETSIIHALTLMNGSFVGAATNPARSELLGAVLESPFLNEKNRIETIYLATLSRMPTEKELEKAQSFINRAATGVKVGGETVADNSKKARDYAIADVFWALINSTEFVFNH